MNRYALTFKDNNEMIDIYCESFRIEYGFVQFFDEFGDCLRVYNSGIVAWVVKQNEYTEEEILKQMDDQLVEYHKIKQAEVKSE